MGTYRGRDGFEPAEMGSSFRRGGRRADGPWNCCLLLLMVPLTLVCGLGVWAWVLVAVHEHEARDDMRHHVSESRSRLEDDAADGTLLGSEIDRDVLTGAPYEPNRREVRRSGSTFTVTAWLTGTAPGLLTPTEAHGCYRFRAVPPKISVQQVPEAVCRDLTYGWSR